MANKSTSDPLDDNRSHSSSSSSDIVSIKRPSQVSNLAPRANQDNLTGTLDKGVVKGDKIEPSMRQKLLDIRKMYQPSQQKQSSSSGL
eukprot:CAMPEP_0168627554 /NCGR_PEP_ID=MMETSP0449_2-20121227/11326_1 /TAXON_ID=1082188 /ORGANISM="Strombidium rassoulzadegani, Strain ras09" /LENGTH=87 /DNA_ID=CAMNT_0008669821 /DNA_START=185 /DNA_END=445 /DNA_ORIENTATION=+